MSTDSTPIERAADRPAAEGGPTALREIAGLFLKLGLIGFGGPAAHIAMMRDEVVTRRRWISEEHFLDLLGATNLIPGPNSTEMAIHIGRVRGGWRGLVVAGLCFILPAVAIVLALAWLYVAYGATPAAEWLLYGVKPVIIAIVVQALWGLGRGAVKSWLLGVVGLAVLALYLLGYNELALLFGGGVLVMLIANLRRLRGAGAAAPALLLGAPATLLAGAAVPVSLATLFLTFLKIGAVLYGSGYILLAFLRNDFVQRLGWLTDRQLLDAVAIGQVTPGPVFTTATFIGYIVAGVPGAILSTIGIFLPSFLFVALTNPLIPRLRRSPWMSAFLDGVNVAAVGLMVAVTWELGRAAIVDWLTAVLALAAALLLVRFKVNSTWLVAGGAIAGLVYHLGWLQAPLF
jgi:chromate transporter